MPELRYGEARLPHRHLHDFRRNAKPERHDATTKTARDDDVAIHADMAISQALTRRRYRRPAHQPHLTAMRETRQLERDARRDAVCVIWLVRQQDYRRIVGHFVECGAEIVDADPFHRTEPPCRHISELIAEAGEPERSAT